MRVVTVYRGDYYLVLHPDVYALTKTLLEADGWVTHSGSEED